MVHIYLHLKTLLVIQLSASIIFRKGRKIQAGFSYVEVMVASLIFVTALLPLMNLAVYQDATTHQLLQQHRFNLVINNLFHSIKTNHQIINKLGSTAPYFDVSAYNLNLSSSCPSVSTSESKNCENNFCTEQELLSFEILVFGCELTMISDRITIDVEHQSDGSTLIFYLQQNRKTVSERLFVPYESE